MFASWFPQVPHSWWLWEGSWRPFLQMPCSTTLFINVNENQTPVGSDTLYQRTNDPAASFPGLMSNHFLARNSSHVLVAIRTTVIVEWLKSHTYPFTFHKTDKMPSTLANLFHWRLPVRKARNYALCAWTALKMPFPRPIFPLEDKHEAAKSNDDDGATNETPALTELPIRTWTSGPYLNRFRMTSTHLVTGGYVSGNHRLPVLVALHP